MRLAKSDATGAADVIASGALVVDVPAGLLAERAHGITELVISNDSLDDGLSRAG